MGLLHTVKKYIHPVTSLVLGRASVVEGVLKNGNRPFRCLFIGNSDFTNYISQRTFAENPGVLRHWRTWIPSVDKLLAHPPADVDICIALLPDRYDVKIDNIHSFKGKQFVVQRIDLSGTIEDVKNRFHKTKRQTSKNILVKSGLTYRISNDLEDFDRFYRSMFLPLIRGKYADLASIESFEEMKRFFLQGFLLLVSHGDKVVSGALCIVKGDRLCFRRSGVLDADEKYIKMGAQNALYLFNIMHAKSLGLKFVDAMMSDAMMNDGVYRAKLEWGATAYPDEESDSSVYYFIPRYSEKVVDFFELNPVIVHGTENRLTGIVGSPKIDEAAEKELCNQYKAPGIENLLVMTSGIGELRNIPLETT